MLRITFWNAGNGRHGQQQPASDTHGASARTAHLKGARIGRENAGNAIQSLAFREKNGRISDAHYFDAKKHPNHSSMPANPRATFATDSRFDIRRTPAEASTGSTDG